MGLPVLILGYSGSGKSASMRNFGEKELALVNVNGKFLPFRKRFNEQTVTDNAEQIKKFLKSAKAKSIVIDDSQYIMANEFMRRSQETGYAKFMEIGSHFWGIIDFISSLPSDVIVYFLHHIETNEYGREKIKTIGKMLDEKIGIEGMFTICLKTVVSDGKYYFATQTNGADPCKTPMQMFAHTYVENDLKYIDDIIRTYYGFKPEEICSDCGAVIMSDKKRSSYEIAAASAAKFGRPLCLECGKKAAALKHGETNAAAAVSA